ncbi:MAG: bifunctional oligoribonuclease/PAP phosphatase NrnA [Phycisphaerae bacterium]|nr:bifunctional oligoribonuclease/PAP phosphatase NrnA [Phycisphaerae bacterium]
MVTHGRPDGDGLGSMSALATAARGAGKTVTLFLPDEAPQRYDYLFSELPVVGAEHFAALAADCDLVVILDTCALAQLDGLGAFLPAVKDKIVVIDHHATADDIGSLQWQDTSAAAAGVMVTELIDELGWPIDALTAEALMTAITTDTGWLRFANTDGRCLRAVAELADAGVRPDKLYKRIYQTARPQRLALLRRMLDSLELHCDEKLAVMTIRKADFEATGARADETENLVNESLRLDSVETAILLVENADCVRVSLRSRDDVDVSAVARKFGGGGHKRAAGLRAATDIDQLKGELIAVCAAELKAPQDA